jgi:GNAT superfamily N-acetyltransferase
MVGVLMVEYRVVKFKDVYEDFMPMMQQHWDEIGHRGGFKDFKLDIGKYLYIESKNLLACFVAIKDGEYVGYVCCTLDSLNHNATEMGAMTDAVYVVPEYRNSVAGIGYRLLKFTEKQLKEQFNVTAMQFVVNTNYDVGVFLNKMGYEVSDIVYTKTLGE